MKTRYQQAKQDLKEITKQAKIDFKTDKPAIRQIINDAADYICKGFNLSDYQRDLLSNYACKLHP